MKIVNLLGNEYSGTIGKSVTASKWKGRNYLKKWFKPTNPNSALQVAVRALMTAGNTLWHSFVPTQRRAYFWYERYRKKNVSPFNALISSYITQEKAEVDSYTAPPTAPIAFEGSVSGLGIDAVKCIVKRTGQSTVYSQEYSVATGATPTALPVEDQNYDMIATHPLYEVLGLSNKTAAELCISHAMVLL